MVSTRPLSSGIPSVTQCELKVQGKHLTINILCYQGPYQQLYPMNNLLQLQKEVLGQYHNVIVLLVEGVGSTQCPQ